MNTLANSSDDLLSSEAIRDPEGYFGRLREDDPIHWNRGQKFWIITKHEDIVSICRQPNLFSSDKLGFNVAQLPKEDQEKYRTRFPVIFSSYPHILSAADNPVHDQMRLVINQVWTPLQMEKRRGRIRGFVHNLLDEIESKETIDFIEDFTIQLPLKVILDFLGLPPEDWREVKKHSDNWLAFQFGSGADPVRWQVGVDGIQGLIDYVEPHIRERKINPGGDYISALLQAEWKGSRLTDEQVLVHCATILFAGTETTTNLLANGLFLLLSHRDQWERLCRDPSLVVSAVEEVIRLEGSVKSMMRYALEDVEIKGKTIRKGDLILLVNTAANCDPSKFSNPRNVDIGRRPNPHLGFGQGIHICLGAPLARVEAQETFSALIQRFPSARLSVETVEYHPILRGRALKALPISLR